jgi:translation elongation factor aEF-1 beta
MTLAILQIKIMPKQNSDLEKIKSVLEETARAAGGRVDKIEEQEIAFGLKALVVTLAWPEEEGTEKAEQAILSINGVSSVDIIDYRRAFG